MKYLSLIVSIFWCTNLLSQTSQLPKATNQSKADSKLFKQEVAIDIYPSELGKTTVKAVKLLFGITQKEQTSIPVKLNLIDFTEKGIRVELLNNGNIIIPLDQYEEATIINSKPGWLAYGIANIKVTAGENFKDKTFLLLKEGDESAACLLHIHLLEQATTSSNIEANANYAKEKTTTVPVTKDIQSKNPEDHLAGIIDDSSLVKKDSTQTSEKVEPKPKKATSKVSILKSPETIMQVLYTSKKDVIDESQDTIQIHLTRRDCKSMSENDKDTVGFYYHNVNFPPKSFVLLDSVKIFDKQDWGEGCALTTVVHVSKKSVDTLQEDAIAQIALKGDEATHIIRLKDKSTYNPDKPFWVEIGSNFDLVDGLIPNNFFSGVFFNNRDIRTISKKNGHKNLGLFAGVYESKSVSTTREFDTVHHYYSAQSLSLTTGDSVGVFKDSGLAKTQQVIRNISLFFSPQVRLSNGSADYNGMHFFLSLWAELQWQRISYSTDYSKLNRVDTMYVPSSNLSNYNQAESSEKNIDIKTHYLGVGFPIYFKENDVNVFFNPVFGITNQPTGQRLQQVFDKTNVDVSNLQPRRWFPFFVFQFRLNEEKYGIAFTGEVRGLTKHNSPPFVSLALTKKFDLTKFIEFQK